METISIPNLDLSDEPQTIPINIHDPEHDLFVISGDIANPKQNIAVCWFWTDTSQYIVLLDNQYYLGTITARSQRSTRHNTVVRYLQLIKRVELT